MEKMFPVQPAELTSLLPNANIEHVASSDDEETELQHQSVQQDRQHTTNEESNGDNNDGTDDDALPAAPEVGPVTQLAQQLRCLFSTITWPIVPLGTILSFALLWVLYAAFVLDVRRSCSRPLHWYAVISLLFVSYAPHHPQVRNYLFEYSPERDGQPRPTAVRLYDQLFHTLCILYVYGGVTLLETCQEDTGKATTTDVVYVKPEEQPSSEASNTCAATCPNLYQALSIYVTTLELFTFALILPLLFLPCVFLWIVRRASAEAEAFSQFQDRLQEEQALLNNGGITAKEIIDSLEKVQLVSIDETNVVLLPLSSNNEEALETREASTARECCICMTEFEVSHSSDIETGVPTSDIIVRTKCKHLFHGACLAGWLGGRWEPNETNQTSTDGSRRRARRTACPLCREDLKPARE